MASLSFGRRSASASSLLIAFLFKLCVSFAVTIGLIAPSGHMTTQSLYLYGEDRERE